MQIPLPCRAFKPLERLGVIARDAKPFEISDAQTVLRMVVFFFRGGKPKLEGLFPVALFIPLRGAVAKRVGA